MIPYDFSLLYQPADPLAGITQNTQEWLDARRGRITASKRAYQIITARDASLLKMMDDMAAELTSPAEEFAGNRATEHGHAFEDQAIGEYRMMRFTDGVIVRTPGMFIHDTFDIASATPDFFEGDDTTGQIKCPYVDANHYKLMHWGVAPKPCTDGHPQYYCQCQFESFVTRRPRIVLVSYHPGVPATDQVYIEVMERDEVMHARFTEKLQWINHMLVNPDARRKFEESVQQKKKIKGIDGVPDLF